MKNYTPSYFQNFLINDAAAGLLRAKNAHLIISFLYTEFRANHIPIISSQELESHLAIFLKSYDEETKLLAEESEDDMFHETLFNDVQMKASYLINKWCSEDKKYIKRYHNFEKIPVVELSPSLERLFTWLENSEPVDFIGTESRFQNILFQLRNLRDNTNKDPKAKIEELKKRKTEIEKEITHIEKTGQTEVFTPVQISEWLSTISRSSRDLLGDFNQIEYNFQSILQEIYREQTESNSTKGEILGYTLDTNRKLRNSPQGQSFSTFWKFLSQDTNNEINTLIEDVLTSLKAQEVEFSDTFLLHLKKYLYQAGHKIIEQNRKLTDRINKLLSQKEIEEFQQIKNLTKYIKQTIFNISKATEEIVFPPNFMEIESKPELNFPQARYPIIPSELTTFSSMKLFDNSLQNPFVLRELFSQFYIDQKKLINQISTYRKNTGKQQFTLAELVKEYPVEKGLAEIVCWYEIATKNDTISILSNETDVIEYIKDESLIKITIPRMIFS